MADVNTDLRCYLTNAGIAAENNSIQLGRSLKVAEMVFGSGLLPDSSDPRAQTSMIKEEYAVPCGMLFDDESPTLLVFKGDLPADVGGFHINEVAIRLESGIIYGYARGKGDYKPTLDQGATDSVRYAVEMYTTNADIIECKIDLSTMYADWEDLEAAIKGHEDKPDPHTQYLNANEHLAAENPHPQYALTESVAVLQQNVFIKSQVSIPAFKVADDRVLKTACALSVTVGGVVYAYPSDTVIYMPSLINSDLDKGFDLAIYATAAGLVASQNFTVPGYTDGVPDSQFFTEENTRRIGGIHYQGGGNYLWLNPHSAYDLHYRPACDDPRGMVRTLAGFWADIYLLNTTPDALGTSAYNAQIADGSSPPKRPMALGGDGSAQYSSFTQYVAAEVLAAYGKRLPNHHEFSVLAHGSETGYAVASDPVTTKFDARARSTIGCEQVSGHLYQWGAEVWDRGNGSSGYAWYAADTDGKGQVHTAGSAGVGAAFFGGAWTHSGLTGSRCSSWGLEPWSSNDLFGARGVCDHLQLA